METATLIIAGMSLVVTVVTLFVTCRMLKYMRESDVIKSKKSDERRHKDILAHIESKKEQLERAKSLSRLSGSGYGPKVEKLKDEISELYSML